MLILDQNLPDALILPEKVSDLQNHLSNQGAHWFSAQPAHVTQDADTDAVTTLQSLCSGVAAERTKPNKDNSRLEDGTLVFQDATHCGFMVPCMDMVQTRWSCAVRFRAPMNCARTLITLNSEDTDNYIFLQQVMGQIIFKDQQATMELTTQLPPTEKVMLVVIGCSADRLWLKAGDNDILKSDPARITLDEPLSLFIGCRNNKARLQKTLGAFCLSDLVFWPNINVLEPDHVMTLEALEDPSLWGDHP